VRGGVDSVPEAVESMSRREREIPIILGIRTIVVLWLVCLPVVILSSSVSVTSETAELFLSKYNWTVKQKLADYKLTLPASFEHQPGDFPVAIYWAYNNEFSKEIGLDLEPCLGSPVSVSIYALKEALPEFVHSRSNARAVIVTRYQAIVGAWIDRGRHYAFACSLNRRSFDDITHRRWGDWLLSSGVVNPENELEKKLARMSPEEVIAFYYNAIDRQDYRLAYATFSRKNAIGYLFSNMSNTELFNSAYSEAYKVDGLENIGSAKLKSIKLYLEPAEYEVVVDMKFKKNPRTLNGDGIYGWYVILTKEIDSLGWRISAIGTGP